MSKTDKKSKKVTYTCLNCGYEIEQNIYICPQCGSQI